MTDQERQALPCTHCEQYKRDAEVAFVTIGKLMKELNELRATPPVTDAQRRSALDHIVSLATLQVGSFGTIEQYNRVVQDTKILRAALSSPAVPVIEGLNSIIQDGRTWYGVAGNIDPVAVPMKDFDGLMRAARAYAALQKGEPK